MLKFPLNLMARTLALKNAPILLAVLLTYMCFAQSTTLVFAQNLDNENFGQPAPQQQNRHINRNKPHTSKRPKGLWLDRKAPPFSKKTQTTTQHNRALYRGNTGRSQQANVVESEELAPLSGTQNESRTPYSPAQNNAPPTQRSWRDNQPSSNNDNKSRSPYPPRTNHSNNNADTFAGPTALTGDVWQDISLAQLTKVAPHLKLPLRSYAYQDLLAQLLLSNKSKPVGYQRNPIAFQAIRFETLYRAGLLGVLQSYLKNIPLDQRTALSRFYHIKTGFALGRNPSHLCEDLAEISADETSLPKPHFGRFILLKSYCAAREGNPQAAQLSTNIAREQGIDAPIAFAVVDFLAGMGTPRFSLPKQLGLTDYLFLSLTGGSPPKNLIEISEPALLLYLSTHKKISEAQRALAAESFTRLALHDYKRLAFTYQNMSQRGAQSSALRRANMYQSILIEQDPNRKARKMKMLLESAKRHDLAFPVSAILLPELKKIPPLKSMNWFASTATEIAMLAKDYPLAMAWVIVSPRAKAGQKGAVANLFILFEILDNHKNIPQKTGLLSATDLANSDYLSRDVLHRLVTVLEALDYNVPIPLWEAASQTPQPQSGYLPPSGALSSLRAAAKAKAPARTILMAIEAMGKEGPRGVHLIGLRDIIQNLRKAGYEKEARRLGFEALYAIWPK